MLTIVLDTETTGLVKPMMVPLEKQPYITELYMLKLDGMKIIDQWSSLIKPPIPCPEEVVKITSITDEMLASEPPFHEVYYPIAKFCLGVERWVMHNAAFDKAMFMVELGRINKRANFPWPLEDYCTVENSRHLSKTLRQDGSPKWMSLTELHELATGKPHDAGAHRAEADVMATYRCYKFLLGER